MKRILLASSTFLALAAANPSFGADMAFKAPWAPGFSWTGCYIGAQGGGGFMKDSYNGSSGDDIFHAGGAIAGGQLGCNYQYQQLVLGIEGEGWWSGVTDPYTNNSSLNVPSVPGSFSYNEHYTATNRWDAALSLRAGWAFDRVLLYAKAGAVWGKFDFSGSYNGNDPTGISCHASDCAPYMDNYAESASKVLPGMLIGFGLEYAFLDNWTAKIEADYLNFAVTDVHYTASYTCPGGCSDYTYDVLNYPSTGQPFTATGKYSAWATEAILKLGLNMKF